MEKLYKNKMSMFDFIKGVGIFFVILYHTFTCWENETSFHIVLSLINSWSHCWMPVFFLASGYWFRPKPVKPYTQNQIMHLLSSYITVGFFSCLFYALIHYIRFRSFRSAIKGTLGVFLAFLLGEKHAFQFGNFSVYDIGPMWFLLTLFLSDILLNLILNNSRIRNKTLFIGILYVAGIFCARFYYMPYCITTTLTTLSAIYIGYRIRESKFLIHKWTFADWSKLAGPCILSPCIAWGFFLILTDIPYENEALLLLYVPIAIILLRLSLYLEQSSNNVIFFFKKLGRYTYWIFMAHTVEMLSIDWRILQEVSFMPRNPFLNFLVVFLIRCSVIAISCLLISFCNKQLAKHRLLSKEDFHYEF